MDAPCGGHAQVRLLPSFPKGTLQGQRFGLLWGFGPAALTAAGAARAAFAAVPGGGDQLPVLLLSALPPQRQFFALGTGKAALLRVVGHVLHPANLFCEFPALFLVVV